jgi:hypothetical protein
VQTEGEDLGTILFAVLSLAEREKKTDLLEHAMKAAEVALLEHPTAHETPSLLRVARWCRQKQVLDDLLIATGKT